MTSLHRLIALVVVWVSFALVAIVTIVNSIFIRTEGVITVFSGIIVGALVATWMIRSMRPVGTAPARKRDKR